MIRNHRADAVNAVASIVPPLPMEAKAVNIDMYGEDVFNTAAINQYLDKTTAKKLLATIQDGAPLDPAIAADVAHAMKIWALDRGATHYTHWFQPMTGSTAEKHDAFLEPVGDRAIMAFSGKNLIVGEPDASSFPSGGLRCTFEARGYTAWDPTSPAFIKRHGNGATMCIPTAFCSYTGDALDKKTPLLRSIQALTCATKRLMRCFDLKDAKVSITLGAEQEYFLIDKRFYLQRPDLLQTGRTLFGAAPAKHQQLEDHYFGSIKSRVLCFMNEVEIGLWKLGIPAKTRHNEAAPAQFELAPMFEEQNLAVDHNMLVMEVLRQTADRFGLVCLLHEKPFAGVNGSGKHNNWSISYGKMNLLNPGGDPLQNAIFLTVLMAIIQAVDNYSDLLRAAVAGAGNDHRLGANEAPPAIISIYLGDQLKEVIGQIEAGTQKTSRQAGTLRIGVDVLPPLPQDATDRNRTSPFAFTGNKFEFRGPGSNQSCSGSNTVINTIVADAFNDLASKIELFSKKDFNEELQKMLKKIIREHKKIIFNGDGYTEAWKSEAAKRGLPNAPDTMSALKAYLSDNNIALFEKYGVLCRRELESRYDIFMEEYHRRIRIEGELAYEIAASMIQPVVSIEYSKIVEAIAAARASKLEVGLMAMHQNAEKIGGLLDELVKKTDNLGNALGKCHEDIIAATAELRLVVDRLEKVIHDEVWPLPKYREMLFIY